MKLKQKLIIGISLMITVPLLILGFMASNKAADIIEYETITIANTLTQEIEKSMTNEFRALSKSLAVLSHDGNLDSASYNAMAKDKLLKVFEGYIIEFPTVQNIYIGYSNQEFIIYPYVELPADYDATARPWYQSAVDRGEVIWTTPYADAASNNIIISAAVPVFSQYNSSKVIGVLAADITLGTMAEEMSQIRIGETGVPVIVDSEGLILLHENTKLVGEKIIVAELLEKLATEDNATVTYIEKVVEEEGDKGKDVEKIGIFHTMEDTGWKILITMEQNEINGKAAPIRNLIIMVGVISLLGAGVLAFFFSNSISKPIEQIVVAMDKVKTGDFKVKSEYKSSDEIGALSDSFNIMVENVATLIKNTQTAVGEVRSSAETLSENADQTSIAAEEVAKTITEIAEGASEQAQDAERGTHIASELSEQFGSLSEISNLMSTEAQQAIEKNEAGVRVVKSLQEKTTENNVASYKVSEAISELEIKSNAIGSIVQTISAISDQTNLLALNASIEAARAGEHGRGFAVVADEIRKLAEESNKAAEEIKNIVGDIQEQSRSTVAIMSDMTSRSEEQAEVVSEVNDAFGSIDQSIAQITGKIGDITTTIDLLSTSKDKMLQAIEGISAVSEETAAASEEVSASMEEQSAAVEQVSSSAEQLNALAEELQEQVSKFNV